MSSSWSRDATAALSIPSEFKVERSRKEEEPGAPRSALFFNQESKGLPGTSSPLPLCSGAEVAPCGHALPRSSGG